VAGELLRATITFHPLPTRNEAGTKPPTELPETPLPFRCVITTTAAMSKHSSGALPLKHFLLPSREEI
jgi:hypothetical protein